MILVFLWLHSVFWCVDYWKAEERALSPTIRRSNSRQGTFQVALVVKNLPINAGNVRDAGLIPRLGGSPREGNGSLPSTLVWEIPQTEEPGRLQSMGSQGVGRDWSDSHTHTLTHSNRQEWVESLLADGFQQGDPSGTKVSQACNIQETVGSELMFRKMLICSWNSIWQPSCNTHCTTEEIFSPGFKFSSLLWA